MLVSDQQVADQVLRSLRQIVKRISEHSKHLFRDAGLTLPQLMCLKAIGGQEHGALTVAGVADAVQLSAPTVSRIVDRLEKAGLVTRERRLDDRRKVCLTLSPAGLERYRTLPVPLQERFLERLLSLAPAERLALLRALRQVSEMMDATGLDAAPMLTPDLDLQAEVQ